MISRKLISLFNAFAESSFFIEFYVKKRDKRMKEMLRSYPQLYMQSPVEMEVGYEASWLMKQAR